MRRVVVRLVKRVGLPLFGLALSLVITEAVVRGVFVDWAPRTAEIARFWQHDALLGWAHIPNARGRFDAFGHATSIAINARGFRDADRAFERDASRYRVVVLGDSMVWGYGVEQDKTFTARMEARCRGLQVLNLGVSGYGTDQELLLLRQEGLRYQPDLVAVVVAPNDFQTNVQTRAYMAYEKPMFVLTPNGDLQVTNVPVPGQTLRERVASTVIRHSFVLNKVASVLHGLALPRTTPESAVAGENDRPVFPRSIAEQITATLMVEMGSVSERAQTGFLVILADGMGRRGRELTEFLAARGIPVVNLDDDFGGDGRAALHLADGEHWNETGHEQVAARLVTYIQAEGRGARHARTEERPADVCG